MNAPEKISFVLSDVDGTLVDKNKRLTPRTIEAVAALKAAGIRFSITSARPPRGMAMLFDPLDLDPPIAGFNGGLFVDRDLNILSEHTLDPAMAKRMIGLIKDQGLDVWVFRGNEWLVEDRNGVYVDHEIRTVQFQPTVVEDIAAHCDEIAKIVGVGEDFDRVKQAEVVAQKEFGEVATVARSQSYYLDFTHLEANKGAVVDHLSASLGIPREEIMTIGDSSNDVRMFARSGFSVAMGNAFEEVKEKASALTDSNADDGFAKAIERYVLRKPT